MRCKVEFAYSPGTTVKIKALGLEGVVRAVRTSGMYTDNADEYFVTWWADGSRREDWLFGDEIE